MLKGVLSTFYIFSLIILNVFFQEGEVAVKMNAPAEVDAGTTFRVSLVLTKSQLEGFSRFAQDIPAGLTATSISSANADFTFQDNRVRLIWLKLPDTDTVQVMYEVKVDERLKGTFSLGGKFSYIEENQRKSVEVMPQNITIIPSKNIDPRLIVDVKNFREKVIPNLGTGPTANVACIRQRPDLTYSQGGIIVSLLVNKEKLEKFAKIEETVPPGYSAIALEKKDAIFTFRDQTVKFLWMTLPSDPWFLVSYKLVPLSGAPASSINIRGVFSYIEGKKTNSVDIVEEDVSFDALNQNRVDKLLASLHKTLPVADTGKGMTQTKLIADKNTGKNTNTVTDNSVHQGNTNQGNTQNTTTLKNNRPDTGPAQKVNQLIPNKNLAENSTTSKFLRSVYRNNEKSVMAYSLEPENGIYYRVQIAAGHKPVNMDKYFRKMTFREQIRTEKHEGWYKYSIGSWPQYREARDYRVQLWNTSPVKDAFVAAYNNGKRITVQEALMVSNQRWYQ